MSSTVEVHLVSLREADWRQGDAILSPAERRRRDRFVFEQDQQAFTVCRAALRRLLGERLGRPAGTLQFSENRYGKPHLTDRSLCFNVSHSKDHALIALSSSDEIGVDIEKARPLKDMMGLARTSFSPREVSVLTLLPRRLQQDAFFRCWSRKEAFIKAIGMGLSFPLDRFDVTLDPRLPARLLAIRAPAHAAAGWVLHHLEALPGYRAALVTRGPATIELFRPEGR